MTREEFIEKLESRGYSYKIEGDKIIVNYEGNVDLRSLETLPPDVVFNNGGYVILYSLETLPSGVDFNNKGVINLGALETLPPNVKFNNGDNIYLNSLKTIHPGIEFNNEGGWINLYSLLGGLFDDWDGNIYGIKRNRLLNLMISKGLFI